MARRLTENDARRVVAHLMSWHRVMGRYAVTSHEMEVEDEARRLAITVAESAGLTLNEALRGPEAEAVGLFAEVAR